MTNIPVYMTYVGVGIGFLGAILHIVSGLIKSTIVEKIVTVCLYLACAIIFATPFVAFYMDNYHV